MPVSCCYACPWLPHPYRESLRSECWRCCSGSRCCSSQSAPSLVCSPYYLPREDDFWFAILARLRPMVFICMLVLPPLASLVSGWPLCFERSCACTAFAAVALSCFKSFLSITNSPSQLLRSLLDHYLIAYLEDQINPKDHLTLQGSTPTELRDYRQ